MSENYKAALEIVKAQASVRAMNVEEIGTMVQDLVKKLDAISGGVEIEAAQPVAAAGPVMDPKKSIKENAIVCLCCGKSFKILTKKHLAEHGLDKKSYLAQFGLKKGTTLACKALVKNRKAVMAESKIWEKVPAGSRGKKKAAESKPAAPKKAAAKKAAPKKTKAAPAEKS